MYWREVTRHGSTKKGPLNSQQLVNPHKELAINRVLPFILAKERKDSCFMCLDLRLALSFRSHDWYGLCPDTS